MRIDFRRSRMVLPALLAVMALAYMFPLVAGAHALLERARPVAGSVVRGAPGELTLWFTERIEPAFSEVRVLNAAGRQLDTGSPLFNASEGKVLRIPLPKLGPGTYRVKWRILSVDTHVSEGEFTFDVAP
jgi:methionine-rich copper-binding protein CopC